MFKLSLIPLSVLALTASLQVAAQPAPAAGVFSGSTNTVPARTDLTPAQNNVVMPAGPGARSMATLTVAGFRFSGHTVMSNAQLQALVADSSGKSMDLAGLEAIAARVSKAYRAQGYTVARAYIPAQQSKDGVIEIAILEGRYSDIVVKAGSPLAEDVVRGILGSNICAAGAGCKGQLVTNAASDRALLLLRDIPGVTAQASLEPGKEVGSSNYVVEVKSLEAKQSSVGYDNYGNSSIGKNRLNYSYSMNNFSGKGDQLLLDAAAMGTRQLSGGVSYSLPVGYAGTRAGVGYSRSTSRLGGVYSNANVAVTGDAVSAYLSHPIVRGVDASLYGRAAFEAGAGKLSIDGVKYKSSTSTMRLGITGDVVDTFGGYNAYSLTSASGRYNDEYVTGVNGRFNKLAYSVSRQQAVSGGFTLFGSLYGQTAGAQLPAGELISVGGPNGVRAYASGEGGNSVGGVGTLEARYTQVLTPGTGAKRASLITYALFADRGWSDTYRAASQTSAPRTIGGTGVGITVNSPDYYVRASLARHGTEGTNASQIDPNSKSQFWLQGGLNF